MSKDNMFPDLKIDEIPCDTLGVGDPDKKKRVNSKKKGNREELKISHELSDIFGFTFRRVPSSGAFTGGMNRNKYEFTEAAKNTLTGDIICPEWFKISLEIKNYFDTPKIHNIIINGDITLDKWIEQAKADAKFVSKKWLLLFNVTEIRKSYACMDRDTLYQDIEKYSLKTPDKFIIYNSNIILSKDLFFSEYIKSVSGWNEFKNETVNK